MRGRQPLKIPFGSKDPRYFKCWNLIRKQGLSVEEALVKMGEPIPAPGPISVVKDPPDVWKKPRAPVKNANQKVTAEDLLSHPGVPDKVKEQLLEAQGDNSAALRSSAQGEGTITSAPAQVVSSPPVPSHTVDTRTGKEVEKQESKPDILNPHLVRWLQRMCTAQEELNKTMLRVCTDLEAIDGALEALNRNMAHTRWGR